MLKKHKPATSTRTAKVAQGQDEEVRPQGQAEGAEEGKAKKKLLFKETVRAGKAKATVYKRLKLIKR